MSLLAVLAVLAAGLVAGTVNALVGSGSLLTFPVLLALGFPPVVANVSNTVGLSVGNVGAVFGYRRELRPQLPRLAWLGGPAIGGAVLGAVLLLFLPQRVFKTVVPVLIVVAVVLVVAQPRLSRVLRREGAGVRGTRWILPTAVFLTAIYGGYFGAAQGVILISVLTILISEPLQDLNALKNGVILLVNGTAAIIFLFVAHVSWEPALLLALSSLLGGRLGASVGRRMPPTVLRGVILVAGVATLLKLLVG